MEKDIDKAKEVCYTYDENGIATLNPIRYRGYYYDEELGLYYLKTRYYDPELGRFMTIDGVSYLDEKAINGLNLYAYCKNNPVMFVDSNGTEAYLVTSYTVMKNGLPIVGHVGVLVWDASTENWSYINFTGSNKTNAEIWDKEVVGNQNEVPDLGSIDMPQGEGVAGSIGRALGVYGYSVVKLGISDGAILQAYNKYGDTWKNDYDGKYRLFTNNCLHFVKDLLNASLEFDTSFNNPIVGAYYKYMPTIIPSVFQAGLVLATTASIVASVYYSLEKATVNLFKDIYKSIKSWWRNL